MSVERVRLSVVDPAVDALTVAVHRPRRRRRPSVLLTPGAGGDLDGEGLVALAEVLVSQGHQVVRGNLPHHELGRRAPRAERSVEPLGGLLAAAREHLGDRRPWILGGKSYGGRVASLAVAGGLGALGLVFYGYPLHPPGRPERLRVEHWSHVGVPCLFLQGTADPFCDLALLEGQLRRLPRRSTLHVVEGGDHSLRVPRAASPTGQAIPAAESVRGLSKVLAEWVDGLAD